MHRNINLVERTNKMQPVLEFIIPMFFNCSTFFGLHSAHYQELKNCNCGLWFYIRFWLPTAAMAQPSQRPQLQFLSSWWWAVCNPKNVEQLKNIGIINSTTRLHLVGSFYEMYNFGCISTTMETTGVQNCGLGLPSYLFWCTAFKVSALNMSPLMH